ncbi:tyrosine-type recombinase/integrase [Lentisphaerota bacterium WC36G]|nr:site-specific integrase [Lentisphaerae bacterium WC36]
MAKNSNSIKLDIGTIYKKTENGNYFFRYQIDGQRQAVSLKTKNKKEALAKASDLVSIAKASSVEVVAAHVEQARNFVAKTQSLLLSMAWDKYSVHPERATPATVSEQQAYRSTFNEFLKFVNNSLLSLADITPQIASEFADHMRTKSYAVDTHNRKIRRLIKIFNVLEDYYTGENPFDSKTLRRKAREEQEHMVKRISFTRQQEEDIRKALDDESRVVKNKAEIKIVYYIGMFTGQRLKDCVLLRWDKIDLDRKRLWVKQFKTGQEVSIPIAPQLDEILTEAQESQINRYVCPNVAKRYNKVDANGKNVGNNLVNKDVLRVIKWVGLKPSVKVPGRNKKVTVYGFHSLRHTFVSNCAIAGIPKAVVLSIIGANSDIIDKYYTHIGDEAQVKAIEAISGGYGNISPQEKIDKITTLINSLASKSDEVRAIEKIISS